MDKRLVKAWIKALRSGKYKQGMYTLKNSDLGFCCLGVACAVNAKVHKKGMYHLNGTNRTSINSSNPVYARLGLTSKRHSRLMELNDTKGKSFNEIADWIEKNILKAA